MTFKEFKQFCNDRSTDGCWAPEYAILCIETLYVMNRTPFWKRKRVWQEFEPIINTFYLEWLEMMREKGVEV